MQPTVLTTIGQIARRHDLATLVELNGTTLSGRPGSQVRQGICPISDHDTSGSFTIYHDSQRFFCFGCGAKGDAIDFTKAIHNCSTQEALNRLGEDTPNQQSISISHNPPQLQPRRRRLIDQPLLTAAITHYGNNLLYEDAGTLGRQYLKSRGISRRTAEQLRLGYSNGSTLKRELKRQGFETERMQEGGLVLSNRRERFSRMVIVPELRNGKPIWMTARTVLPNRTIRFNSLPGTKMTLGIGTTPQRAPYLIVSEGVFDWLTLREWGLYSVALGGKGASDRQIRDINKLRADRVILALDADEAGQQLTAELLETRTDRPLLNNASAMSLPSGFADIAEMATVHNGRQMFLRAAGLLSE